MSEHMGIPSFIQNVNYLARNMHLLELGEELLTPETVKALTVATGLPFSEIIKDISKGVTPEGRRKIDISYAEVPELGGDYAHYNAVTITGSLDEFSHTHYVDSVGVHELYEVRELIKDAIEAYNSAAALEGFAAIENYIVEIWHPEDVCKRPIVRVRDDDQEMAHAFLAGVSLHTAEGIVLTTTWHDTTSSILIMGTIPGSPKGYADIASNFAAASEASAKASDASRVAAESAALTAYAEADRAASAADGVKSDVAKGIYQGVSNAINKATTQATRSKNEADRSKAEADKSERMKNDIINSSAFESSGVFSTTSAGIVGTSSDDLFWVYPNDENDLENLMLYRNVSDEAVMLFEQFNLHAFMIEEGANWETGL